MPNDATDSPESQTAQSAYAEPELYDLEHAKPEPDVEFFIRHAQEQRARRILEIACGNGRVTIPLAQAASAWGGRVTGLELAPEMLDDARQKPSGCDIEWIEGNMIDWRAPEPFDLMISPCGSLGHLTKLQEQLGVWRTAFENLKPGGRFVVSEPMANLAALAESMHSPPRAVVELDLDTQRGEERLLRCRAARYRAHEQQLSVHYLYDRFEKTSSADRIASGYEGHVYFPNELQLLAICAGFSVDAVWGNHEQRPLAHTDRTIILIARKGPTIASAE